MPIFLGIDVGTSSVKAVLLSASGCIEQAHAAPLTPRRASNGRASQDPEEWLTAIDNCVTVLTARRPKPDAVGVCFSCSTLVPLTGKTAGEVGPAILWCDTSCSDSARAIGNAPGLDGQHVISPSEPAARFHHWRRENPDVALVEGASWILKQLTGCWCLPSSIFAGRWGILASDILRPLVFEAMPLLEQSFRQAFMPLAEFRSRVGQWKRSGRSGPLSGVPVYTSGNDGMTALYGSGFLFERSTLFLHWGTSRYCVLVEETPQAPGLQRLPNLDILFSVAAFINDEPSDKCTTHDVQKDFNARRVNTERTCLIGGGFEAAQGKSNNDWPPDGTADQLGVVVNCGRYAGAAGAAALARVAVNQLEGDDPQLLAGLRSNWSRAE